MSARFPVRDKIALIHTRSEDIAEDIKARGFVPLSCPVLDIHPMEVSLPDADVYILTSAHAVTALKNNKTKIIAVGQQTREAALKAGLTLMDTLPLQSAEDLVGYDLPYNAILHIGGSELSPSTNAILSARAIPSIAVYKAVARDSLPDVMERALGEGRLAAVLCFSARSAQVFTHLALCATNTEHWQAVDGLALSPRIAQAMQDVPFASLRAAAHPHRNAILEMLSDDCK